MYLFVEQFGAFVAKHQRRLRVLHEQQRLEEVPLLQLEQVLISGNGVGLSSDAVRACAEVGIPIHFVSQSGTPYASLYSAGLTGTVLTRRAQLRAYDDARGGLLARAVTEGKLRNQAMLLRYMAKNRRERDAALAAELEATATLVADALAAVGRVPGVLVEELRGSLLGIEGGYAVRYWQAVGRVLPPELGWTGRTTRGATDAFNQVLNYGYGILYKQVEYALVLAGLDPYAGMLHADRPGKPSLVLDVIEEFRQAVVDRTLIGQVTRGWQIERDEQGLLTKATRERIVERVLGRLESAELYGGKRQPLRHIVQQQARQVATFVRGERERYEPFVMGW